MRAPASEQSRILRLRLFGRMVLMWLLYTILFALAVLAFNGVVSPRLGDWVADSTSEWVEFHVDDIRESYTYEEMLDSYLQRTYPGTITLEKLRDGQVTIVDESFAIDNGVLVDGAAVGVDSDTMSVLAIHDGELQPDFLAAQMAWAAYEDMRLADPATADDWVISYLPDTDDGSFAVRNLSTYHHLKALKWPLLIAIYCIGCAVIVIVLVGRLLRYFDSLAGAVGSVIHDRETPVELPSDLFVVQAELNGLRLESLADERAAMAAEQRKNELVAYLAHDIRTPLTSVLGYLSLLEDAPDLPVEQRVRFTGLALQKAERLEVLVNEFFDITRYNLQSIPIERQRIGLGFFLDQIAEEFYPQASVKGVSIRVQAPPDTEFFVDGDKLARAVGNVVRNAVAYADEGTEVVLEAELLASDGSRPGFRLRVVDQGREIAPHHLESIFEKFYREDSARGAATGNAGLGLAIAKEILLAHGGTISAESSDGLTTFTMDLPASAC